MSVTAKLSRSVSAGEMAFVPQGNPKAKAGALFLHAGRLAAQVVGRGFEPGDDTPARFGLWLKALQDLDAVELELQDDAPGQNQALSLAWVTLSDKASQGLREDASGPTIERMCRESLNIRFARGFVMPDELRALKALLCDLALLQSYDLILTTGGTGLGPRDITPEATLAVIEKRLPGFEQAMMAASLTKTPHAGISRAVAGTLGGSVIVNMPGSRKAVSENLEAVLPALAHAVAKLQGDPADCGA